MNPLFMKYFAKKDPQIAERYSQIAGDDEQLNKALGDQKKAKMVGLFGQGLSTFATAHGRARGYSGNSDGFWGDVSKFHDDDVSNAKAQKRDKLDNLLMGDSLQWQGVERERQGNDWAAADADRAAKRAREGVLQGREDAEYNRGQGLMKVEDDPSSDVSAAYRSLAQKMTGKPVPGSASATKLKAIIPALADVYKIDEARKSRLESAQATAGQQNFDNQIKLREMDLKEKEAKTKVNPQGLKLNGEQQKRYDNINDALLAIDGMDAALDQGDNTFSLVGDNEFTRNRSIFEEAFGRMQSGGAITEDETVRFKKMLPRPTDSAEMQRKKLSELRNIMKGRKATITNTTSTESAAPEEKVVKGVRYRKVEGGWELVE